MRSCRDLRSWSEMSRTHARQSKIACAAMTTYSRLARIDNHQSKRGRTMSNSIITTLRNLERKLKAGENAQEAAQLAGNTLRDEMEVKRLNNQFKGSEQNRYSLALGLIERAGERGQHPELAAAITRTC